jgi:uncharacterized protein involved in response to NO
MLTMQYYPYWVLAAAVLWTISFSLFVVIYAPILLKPRADGVFG